MANSKCIDLLIGPKGSGKSYIGQLMQKEFGIPFIRVEDWARSVKRNKDVLDDEYAKGVFKTIEAGIRKSIEENETLVFESTGLTNHFDRMYESLSQDFNMVTIGVQTDLELCLKRVRSRDQSIHIAVSDDQVRKINDLVAMKGINTDFTLQNSNQSIVRLREQLSKIIGQRPSS